MMDDEGFGPLGAGLEKQAVINCLNAHMDAARRGDWAGIEKTRGDLESAVEIFNTLCLGIAELIMDAKSDDPKLAL